MVPVRLTDPASVERMMRNNMRDLIHPSDLAPLVLVVVVLLTLLALVIVVAKDWRLILWRAQCWVLRRKFLRIKARRGFRVVQPAHDR